MSETRQTILSALGADRLLSAAGLSNAAAIVAQGLEHLRTAVQAQSDALSLNTQAVISSVAAVAGGGVASVVADIAGSTGKSLLGGLSMGPLVSGIVGLFTGGGDNSEPPPLVTYQPPPSVQFEGAASQEAGGQIRAASYDQYGQPRQQAGTAPFFAPAITVQVQAMDSRSFLDHSDDIAQAVREAILNGHALSGVVNES